MFARSPFWIILKKEFLESLRDKTTLIVNYVLPIIGWPLIIVITSGVAVTEVARRSGEVYETHVYGEAPEELLGGIKENKSIHLSSFGEIPQPLGSALATLRRKAKEKTDQQANRKLTQNIERDLPSQNAMKVLRAAIDTGRAHVILVIEKESSAPESRITISAVYDPIDGVGSRAMEELDKLIDKVKNSFQKRQLATLGISDEELNPVSIERLKLATESEEAINIFGKILPMLLCYLMCLSTCMLAVGSFVTERERGTLALLVSAPVTSFQIVIAKFVHVVMGGLISLGLHAMTIGFLAIIGLRNQSFAIEIRQPALLIALLVCVALSIASISMLAGILSRTIRQAEGILSIVMLILLVPAGLTASADQIGWTSSSIPLFNALLGVGRILSGPVSPAFGLIICSSNILFTAFMLALSTQLFRATSAGNPILLETKGPLSDKTPVVREAQLPTSKMALGLLIIAMATALYGGMVLNGIVSMLVQQLVFICVPILCAWHCRLSWQHTFNTHRTNPRSLIGACIIGISAALLVMPFLAAIDVPKEFLEQFTKMMLQLKSVGGLPAQLIVLALLPAICEEVFFRGMLLNGLRVSLPGRWAVILSAIFFGFFHLPLIRMFPATFGGILMAVAVIRTQSLWISMTIHFIYNALLITIADLALTTMKSKVPPAPVELILFSAGLLGLAFGFLLLKPSCSAKAIALAAPSRD